MDHDLFDQLLQEVLLLRVRSFLYHPLEVGKKVLQHLLVKGRQLDLFAPGLQVTFLSLKLPEPRVQVAHLLVAHLGLQFPRLERLEVAVNGRLVFDRFRFDLLDLLIEVRLLGRQPLVRLLPNARHELLVHEHRLHVLDDSRFQQVRPHVVLIALARFGALETDVVSELPALLVLGAGADHGVLAFAALDNAGEEPLVAVVPHPALQVLVAFYQDLLRLLEEDLGDDRLVRALVHDLYLVGMIDDYSRYIVGHVRYRQQTAEAVLEVVKGAARAGRGTMRDDEPSPRRCWSTV